MDKSDLLEEFKKCKEDPSYFISNYVKVTHPVRGLVPFKLYPFQNDILDALKKHRFNVLRKFRQAGCTTISAAYSLWMIVFQKHKQVVILSKGDAESTEVLDRIKIMYEELPAFIRPKIVEDNKHTLKLSTGSTIKSRPSGKQSGRSLAGSLLIIDEAAFVRNFDDLWMGLYPTISTGGRVVILSTPNGVGGQYYKLYTDAEAGLNEFEAIRLPWNVHPERDDEWFKKTTKNLSSRQISQEYLCDFASSGETFLSDDEIEWLRLEAIPPKERAGPDMNVWIWKYPLSEHQYVISADIARGDSKDFSTFHVIDMTEGECVAEYKGKIPPDRFAELLHEFGHRYNKALLCPENNSYGYATVLKLKEMQYPNLYHKKRKAVFIGNYAPPSDSDIGGFTTTGKTRNIILSKLEEVIRNKQIKIYSTRFYDELKTFIWKGNRAQAMKGYNDDLVISMAIGMWLYDASAEYSKNTKGINQAMLDAMKMTRNTYDDMPGAITEGRPHSSQTRDPKLQPDDFKRSSLKGEWNKKLNILSEWDWVYK